MCTNRKFFCSFDDEELPSVFNPIVEFRVKQEFQVSFKLRTWLRRLWSSCQSWIACLCDCSPRGRGGIKASTPWCKVQIIPSIRDTSETQQEQHSLLSKNAKRRQVPNLSSAASFPVQMESVDVSIVNYFTSISSSAAWQDIIKCAAWSNQSVPKADIRVKLQLQCKLGHCEVFYKSCEVTL